MPENKTTSFEWEVARILVEGFFDTLLNNPPGCPTEAIAMEMIAQGLAKIRNEDPETVRKALLAGEMSRMVISEDLLRSMKSEGNA